MKSFNPYINFAGNTRAALEFYQQCFNGEILHMQTFGEAQQEVSGEELNRIMHAEFKAEGIHIMASDGMPGDKVTQGDTISLSINFTDEAEQTDIFNSLSNGGIISMPLQDTFWGARFGMLTDRFGIHWMFNCYKQQ